MTQTAWRGDLSASQLLHSHTLIPYKAQVKSTGNILLKPRGPKVSGFTSNGLERSLQRIYT